MKGRDLDSVFYMQITSFPSTICWRDYPSLTYVLVSSVKHQMDVTSWIFVWVFYSVPLVSMVVFVPELCNFYYYNSVTYFEVRNCDISSIALPLSLFLSPPSFSYIPPSLHSWKISTGLIFPFTLMCTQYSHHIHHLTPFPTSFPLQLVPTPLLTGLVLPSCSLIL
jgi:hypothetical protein